MKSTSIFKRLFSRRKNETGLSLVETLVAMTLFIVVAVIIVSIVTATMNSANRLGGSTTTQGAIQSAMTNMQRDFSYTNNVEYATSNAITVNVTERGTVQRVTYFEWDPNTRVVPAGVTSYVNVNNLPIDDKAIVMVRANTQGKVIVQGFAPDSWKDVNQRNLFSYYDIDNNSVAGVGTGALTPQQLDQVKRIEFRIAANVEGRGTPIQMSSSASTNNVANGSPASEFPGSVAGVPNCPAPVRATIRERETEATITWYPSQGATSYTIYREPATEGFAERVHTISDPDVSSWVDTGLSWGETYTWYVQAAGTEGVSVREPACVSTSTVVPQQISTFANVNSLAPINSAKVASAATVTRAADGANLAAKTVTTVNPLTGVNYTVARGSINQLAWQPNRHGVTGYRIYDASDYAANRNVAPLATINNPSTSHTQFTDLANGAVSDYVLIPFNAGGEATPSSQQILISPPTASTFNFSRPDTSTNASYTDTNFSLTNRAANTFGYRVTNNATFDAATNCSTTGRAALSGLYFENDPSTSSTNRTQPLNHTTASWGSTNCYQFIPFNDAGNGALSELRVNHLPGKFGVSIVNVEHMRVVETGVHGYDGVSYGNQRYTEGCWVNVAGVSESTTSCHNWGPRTPSSHLPSGSFSNPPRERTIIQATAGHSSNAYGGYVYSRDRVDSRVSGMIGGLDQSPDKVRSSGVINYQQNTHTSARFNHEMPGSRYELSVRASAANGQTRTNTTSIVSVPDVTGFQTGRYESNRSEVRLHRSIMVSAYRGYVSEFVSRMRVARYDGWNQADQWRNIAANNNSEAHAAVYTDYHQQVSGGENYRSVASQLTRDGISSRSAEIGRTGGVNFNFGGAPGVWVASGEYYPQYFTGWPSRAWSAVNFPSHGSIQATQNPAVAAPDIIVDPASTELQECISLVENEANFLEGCTYGDGTPPVPSGLNVTSSNGNARTLTWDAWHAIKTYQVQVTINGTTVTHNVTTNQANIQVPGGANAEIRVRSQNAILESKNTWTAWSGVFNYQGSPLASPTNLSASNVNTTSFTLNWTAVPYATGYTITYTPVGGTSQTRTAAANATSIGITGATQNTVYNVSIVAHATPISSPASPNLVVNTDQVVNAPTNLSLENPTPTSVRLAWDAPSNASRYTIKYQNTTKGTALQTVTLNGQNSTYNLTGLIAGDAYAIRVQAHTATQNSIDSNQVVFNSVVTTPANLRTTSVGSTTTAIAWDAASGATSYTVSWRVGTNAWSTATVTGATTYNITGLTPGTAYQMKIQAHAGAASSSESANVAFTTGLAQPSGLAVTNITPTGARLGWTSVNGATSYTVTYRVVGTTNWTTVGSLTATNTTLSTLAPASNYEFRVQAHKDSINSSVSGTTAWATTLATPTNLRSTALGTTTANIAWNASTGATSYVLSWKQPTATTWTTATVTGTTHTITNMIANASYEIKIQAIAGTIRSAESATITVKTSVATPTNLRTTNVGAVSASVAWDAAAGAANYTLFWKANSASNWTSATVTGTTHNITGLNVNSSYQMYVRAQNGEEVSGNSSTVNFTTLFASPAGTMTMTTANAANVANGPVLGSVSYTGITCAVGTLQSQVRTEAGLTIRAWAASNTASLGNLLTFGVSNVFIVDFRCETSGQYSDTVTHTGLTRTQTARPPVTTAPAVATITAGTVTSTGTNAYTVHQYSPFTVSMAAVTTCPTGWTPRWNVNVNGATSTKTSNAYSQTLTAAGAQPITYRVACHNATLNYTSTYTAYSEAMTATASMPAPATPTAAPTVSTTTPAAGVNFTMTFNNLTCPAGFTPRYVYWVGDWVGEPVETTERVHTLKVTAGDTSALASEGIWYVNECVLTSNPTIFTSSGASPARKLNVINIPAAPAAPNVSNLIGQNATVSWTAVAGATSYRVTNITSTGATRSWTTTATSLTVPYMSDTINSNVGFRINAINAAGTSANSPVRNIKPLVGDYTRDGTPDITAHNSQQGEARIYPGNGTGQLAAPIAISQGWNDGFMPRPNKDIDNDGHLDIVAHSTKNGLIYFYKMNGSAQVSRTQVASGLSPVDSVLLSLADYNKDGNIDIAYISLGTLYFMAGNGNGTFDAATVAATGIPRVSQNGGVGDYNGDNNLDFIVKLSNTTFLTYTGNGNGGFTRAFTSGTGWGNARILSSWDIGNTGRDNFVAINPAGNLNTWTWSGDGTNLGLSSVNLGQGWGMFYDYTEFMDFNKNGAPDFMARGVDDLNFYNGTHSTAYAHGARTQFGTGWGGMTLWGDTPHVTVESNQAPTGDVNSISAQGSGNVYMRGWTLDRDTIYSQEIHVYVSGTYIGKGVANATRQDVANVYPTWGSNRGFDLMLNTTLRGSREVCIYAIDNTANANNNTLIGCSTINIT